MNIEIYKDKGLTGLQNLGNTCFINTVIQILSHTYELNNFLSNKTYLKKLNKKYDSALLVEWDELRTLMWSENCIISPGKFAKVVQKVSQLKGVNVFSGFNQNDVSEFLCFLIDCFHNALSRQVKMTIDGNIKNDTDKIAVSCFQKIKQMYEKDYSEILQMFYGMHVSVLENLHTNETISMNPEPFFILNLPIPTNKNASLLDCFDLYTEKEDLDEENKVTLSSGEKVRARKYLSFWSFPDILVIDIKRFNSLNRKNQAMIDFPLENLNLSKYVIGYNKNSYVYDLYGICNHSGSVLGGHYTAFVKNANGKWYHFNDSFVSQPINESSIITPNAYCFFYRKRLNNRIL